MHNMQIHLTFDVPCFCYTCKMLGLHNFYFIVIIIQCTIHISNIIFHVQNWTSNIFWMPRKIRPRDYFSWNKREKARGIRALQWPKAQSIYIRTVSSFATVVYFADPVKTSCWPFGQSNMHSTQLISAPDQPWRKLNYRYIREAKSLLS